MPLLTCLFLLGDCIRLSFLLDFASFGSSFRIRPSFVLDFLSVGLGFLNLLRTPRAVPTGSGMHPASFRGLLADMPFRWHRFWTFAVRDAFDWLGHVRLFIFESETPCGPISWD